MRELPKRRFVPVALVALAGGLAFAATGSGSAGSDAETGVTAKMGSVATGKKATATARMSSHARTGVKFAVLRTSGTVGPGEYAAGTGTCPKTRPHPMSGFFSSNSAAVVLTENRPHSLSRTNRRWTVGVTNFGDEPARFSVGVMCMQ
jgi:hypothetical protein